MPASGCDTHIQPATDCRALHSLFRTSTREDGACDRQKPDTRRVKHARPFLRADEPLRLRVARATQEIELVRDEYELTTIHLRVP